MQLAYMDESYDASYYWMSAVLLDSSRAADLQAGLEAAMAECCMKHFGTVPDGLEFHGYDLFHGERDWERLKDKPRVRIAFYAAALKALADSEVRIYLRGMDRQRQAKRYDNPWGAHDVVLQHLLERVNDASPDGVLIVADELPDPDRYRRLLEGWRMSGTPGYRPTTLRRIIDTIHFVPSHSSRLVQASDLVSFLHFRIDREHDTRPDSIKANKLLWSIIEPRVVQKDCWHP